MYVKNLAGRCVNFTRNASFSFRNETFVKQWRCGWKYIAKVVCHRIIVHDNMYSNDGKCIYEIKGIVCNLKCIPYLPLLILD